MDDARVVILISTECAEKAALVISRLIQLAFVDFGIDDLPILQLLYQLSDLFLKNLILTLKFFIGL